MPRRPSADVRFDARRDNERARAGAARHAARRRYAVARSSVRGGERACACPWRVLESRAHYCPRWRRARCRPPPAGRAAVPEAAARCTSAGEAAPADPWEGDVDTVILDRSNFTRYVPPPAPSRARAGASGRPWCRAETRGRDRHAGWQVCARALCDAAAQLTFARVDSFINSNKLVMIEFYTPWCGHCRQVAACSFACVCACVRAHVCARKRSTRVGGGRAEGLGGGSGEGERARARAHADRSACGRVWVRVGGEISRLLSCMIHVRTPTIHPPTHTIAPPA